MSTDLQVLQMMQRSDACDF